MIPPRLKARRDWCRAVITSLTVCACQPSDPVSSEATPVCKAGQIRDCVDETRDCDGVQACSNSETWGACECVSWRVGRKCATDQQCGTRELCLDDDARFLDGTAPGGTCSLRCEQEPGVCETTDPASLCVVTDDRDTSDHQDDRAHCLERCEIGAGPEGKCHERTDVVCAALADAEEDGNARTAEPVDLAPDEGVCRPLCTSDEQCAWGICNPRTGACTKKAPSGGATGAPCDPNSATPPCAGICVEVDGASFCSNRCVLGDIADCNDVGQRDDQRRGLCRFPEESNGNVGDVGFCSLLCDCDADCANPDLFCSRFGSASLESITESLGVCTPRERDSVGLSCDRDAAAPHDNASTDDASTDDASTDAGDAG